jgi:hypothetical protein
MPATLNRAATLRTDRIVAPHRNDKHIETATCGTLLRKLLKIGAIARLRVRRTPVRSPQAGPHRNPARDCPRLAGMTFARRDVRASQLP